MSLGDGFRDRTGLLKRELAEDGLHPGHVGYALMALHAQKAIDQVLANGKPEKWR